MNQYRFTSPGLFPPVIKNLLIINVLVFLAQSVFGKSHPFEAENLFALHDIHSVYFKPHQLITHMFMHGGAGHLFFNMFALWMFGTVLETQLGSKRFLTFYLLSGLGAALLHLGVLYVEMQDVMRVYNNLPGEMQLELLYSPEFKVNIPTVGASGAVFGCLAAFGYLFPNSPIYIYFLFPMKAKWFVILYAGLELMMAVQNSAGDTVAHFAHLGGALTGFLIVYFWNKTNRRTFY